MAKTCNVALLGQGFMGRTHANAYMKVSKFFDVPIQPVMHTTFGLPEEKPEVYAQRWGWQNVSHDWKKVIRDPDIDLVDIVTPNYMHAPMAIASLEAGKHTATEKPLAGTLADARAMRDAAAKAKKAKTFVWYNYRRCPAVALAHQLVRAGKIGRIYHVRAVYLQSWGGPETPLLWRFQKKLAGSGAHGDLNAHIIDMAQFITGDEIVEVTGAISETWIKQRDLPTAVSAGGIAAGAKGGKKKGRSDVDDAVLFLARFRNGAVASFEATRLATGNFNANGIEINGEKGAIKFNFEDMNLLWYFDATADPKVQGWTRIMCTSAGNHPYAANWWPDAHIIGYEHSFVNMAADIMTILAGKKPVVPMPDFADAYETQRVLEAALLAAKNRAAVKISEVK